MPLGQRETSTALVPLPQRATRFSHLQLQLDQVQLEQTVQLAEQRERKQRDQETWPVRLQMVTGFLCLHRRAKQTDQLDQLDQVQRVMLKSQMQKLSSLPLHFAQS